MMHARLAAGSRLRARSSSCRTIWRTSSCVTAALLPAPSSTDITPFLLVQPARSRIGPDHREDAVVRARHAPALDLRDEPVVRQAGPLQRRLVGALPEVTGLDVAAAADRHQ